MATYVADNVSIHPRAEDRRRRRDRPVLRDRPQRPHRPRYAAGEQRHDDGPRHARPAQPHLSRRRHRRRAARPQLPRQRHPGDHRRPQHHPRVRHDQPRHRKGRRHHRPSAATTFSWPAATWPTTAGWATTSSSPTARCWAATSTSTTTPRSRAPWPCTITPRSAATASSAAAAACCTTCRRSCWSKGHPARPRCINVVALKRNDFPPEVINCLAEAHRLLYRAKVGLDHAREILRGNDQLMPQVNELLSFVQVQQEGKHGRARERRRAA